MKNILRYKINITSILISFLFVFLNSCQDVIDIDVPTSDPKLVIDASIDWEKETSGVTQEIFLSTSTSYFENNINSIVTGAQVKITNDLTGSEFVFLDQNNGKYITNEFIPEINSTYTLEIEYNNEIYKATEQMKSVPEIEEITQSSNSIFDLEVIDLNVSFNDPENEQNFYLFEYFEEEDMFPELLDVKDEFFNGNLMTIALFIDANDEDGNLIVEEGDIVHVKFRGISERYYNFIRRLIEQAFAGDPFETTPSQLRGNCVNITNPDNYPFGYFRLSELVSIQQVIE